MKAHTSLLILILMAAWAMMPDAQAQTCRVTSGISADGHRQYMEVYEFDFVEEKPVLPGSGTSLMGYINEHRRYPAEAYARGIEGRVICSFVVKSDGKISHISVLRGVEPSLNREAVRILSGMPDWNPGKIDGHSVPVRVICAVPFRK